MKKGLIFLATAHDESRIDWLKKMNVSSIKIGSGEKNNYDFIKKLGHLNKPLIISTGMYDNNEVKNLLDFCSKNKFLNVILLHCVTSYPVPIDQINLVAILQMKNYF